MLFRNKIQSLYQLQDLLEQEPNEELLTWLKNDPVQAIREIADKPDKELKDYQIKSLDQAQEKLNTEPYLREIIKRDPDGFVKYMARQVASPEHLLYKIIIGSLCAIVIIVILGVLSAWLIKNSREAPTLITAVACTALGLLAGIFVKVPIRASRKPDHTSEP